MSEQRNAAGRGVRVPNEDRERDDPGLDEHTQGFSWVEG
jgi:hypothetical protein